MSEKKGIPQNIKELYQAYEMFEPNDIQLNEKISEQLTGKKVDFVTFDEKTSHLQENFVLVSYKTNWRFLDYQEHILKKHDISYTDETLKENGQRVVDNAFYNEVMGYDTAKFTGMSVPEYYVMEDKYSATKHIAMAFIDGEDVDTFFSNDANQPYFDTVRKNAEHIAARHIIMGNSDALRGENTLVKNHNLIHFDFDLALQSSIMWDNDFDTNTKNTVQTLENFIEFHSSHPDEEATLFQNPDPKKLLKGFSDTWKDIYNASEYYMKTTRGVDVYNQMRARTQAGIDYLKK